jgi:hypothetical protein
VTSKIPPCSVCGTHFNNIFEATDHLLEEEGEEFDPVLILPNGYSLLVGSLLREIFYASDDQDRVRHLTEMAYGTLYAAETNVELMKDLVEEAIVSEYMTGIDLEIEELMEEEDNDD